jgi:hypothetical protein
VLLADKICGEERLLPSLLHHILEPRQAKPI